MQSFFKIYLILFCSSVLMGCSVFKQSDKEFTYRKYLGRNGQEMRFCLEPRAKQKTFKEHKEP